MQVYVSSDSDYQSITLYTRIELTVRDGVADPIHRPCEKYDIKDALEIADSRRPGMTYEITLQDHMVALNCLPSDIGNKWKITEEIYWYFLEMLPPVYYKNGFLMSEKVTGDIRSYYYQIGGNYYHEYVEVV